MTACCMNKCKVPHNKKKGGQICKIDTCLSHTEYFTDKGNMEKHNVRKDPADELMDKLPQVQNCFKSEHGY